eukprot:999365-Pleurochrysis_carterae.AAC.2
MDCSSSGTSSSAHHQNDQSFEGRLCCLYCTKRASRLEWIQLQFPSVASCSTLSREMADNEACDSSTHRTVNDGHQCHCSWYTEDP